MAVARREHFGKLLEPGLRKIFYEFFKQIPSLIGEIFSVQSTSNPNEQDVGIGTLGEFPEFTGTVAYDRMYQGYTAQYEFPEFAKGFMIERKLFDDERYSIIKKQPQGLATSASRKREMDAAKVFNLAFDTAGPDGKPLCADNHPSPAPDGPPKRNNLGKLKLGHAAIAATRLAMRNTLDDRGGKVLVMPDTILVPPALEEKAWQIVTAEGKLETEHPGTNPNIHHGKYKVMVWDYLTSDDVWFMIDSNYSKMFLNWFDRVPLEFGMEEDFDTFIAKFRAYMRYNCGWSDWVWIYGHTGEEAHSGDTE